MLKYNIATYRPVCILNIIHVYIHAATYATRCAKLCSEETHSQIGPLHFTKDPHTFVYTVSYTCLHVSQASCF